MFSVPGFPSGNHELFARLAKPSSSDASASTAQLRPQRLPRALHMQPRASLAPEPAPQLEEGGPVPASEGSASRTQLMLQRMQQQRQASKGIRQRAGAEGTSSAVLGAQGRERLAKRDTRQKAQKGRKPGRPARTGAQSQAKALSRAQDQSQARTRAQRQAQAQLQAQAKVQLQSQAQGQSHVQSQAQAQAQVQLNRAITGAATLSELLELLEDRARAAAATAQASTGQGRQCRGRGSAAGLRSASDGVSWDEASPLEAGGSAWAWLSPFNAVTALHRVARHLEAQKASPAVREGLVSEAGGVLPGVLGVARGALEQLLGDAQEERGGHLAAGSERERIADGATAVAEERREGKRTEGKRTEQADKEGREGEATEEVMGEEHEEEEEEEREGEEEEEEAEAPVAGANEENEVLEWKDLVAQWWGPPEDDTEPSRVSLGPAPGTASETSQQPFHPATDSTLATASAAGKARQSFNSGVNGHGQPTAPSASSTQLVESTASQCSPQSTSSEAGGTPMPEVQAVADSQLPQMLANLAWALSKLATSSNALVPEFNLLQRALLIQGPSLRTTGGSAAGTADQHGVPVVHRLSAQHVANVSAAYAKARHAAPALMDALGGRVARLGPSRFSPQELSQTLWAFAVLAHPLPPPFLRALAQLSPQQAATTGTGVSTTPEAARPPGDGLERGSFGAGPRSSAGAGTAPELGGASPPQGKPHPTAPPGRALASWSEQQLSNAAWACAVLEHLEEPFFAALWGELLSREALFRPHGETHGHDQHSAQKPNQDQQQQSPTLSQSQPQSVGMGSPPAGPAFLPGPPGYAQQGATAHDLDPPQPPSVGQGRVQRQVAAGAPRAGARLRHLSQLHQVSISLLLLQQRALGLGPAPYAADQPGQKQGKLPCADREYTEGSAWAGDNMREGRGEGHGGGDHGEGRRDSGRGRERETEGEKAIPDGSQSDVRATWLWGASLEAWRREGEATRRLPARMSLCHKEVLRILFAGTPQRRRSPGVPRGADTATPTADSAASGHAQGTPQNATEQAPPMPSLSLDVPAPKPINGSSSSIEATVSSVPCGEGHESGGARGREAAQGGEGEEWVVEHCGPDTFFYSLDLALPGVRVAVEIDGPSHFTSNTGAPLGSTLLKRRHLRALGWGLAPVPFFEWQRLVSREEKKAYIQELVRKAYARV